MKDELDDQLTSLLRGHMELSPELAAANESGDDAAAAAQLPKLGPAVSVTPGEPTITSRNGRELGPEQGPRLAGAFPDTFATPVARPGSIPSQVGSALTAAAKPKATAAVNLAGPLGAPADPELRGLQADAKSKRSNSMLGQAVTDFTERPTNLLDYAQRLGGGGVSAPPAKNKTWEQNAAEGDRAISDLEQRRTSDAGLTKSRTMADLAAEKKDPNSQTAQTYRSVLVKFAPDLAEQLKNATPEQMERIAPWLEKFAAENNDLLQAKVKADADAKTKAAAKEQHDADKEAAQKNSDRSYEASMANARATQGLAAASLGIRKTEVEKKAADDVKDDVKDLAKALPGDLDDFDQKATEIQAMIDGANGDIPGVGFYDSKKPAFMRTQKDNEMQKKAGQMQAAYQKLVTGTGGGEKELANLERIGLMLSNEASFVEGFNALREAYHAKVRQVRKGFADPVLQQYDKNATREAPKAAGTVEVVDKKGGKYNVPAAEAEALKAELRAEGLL